MGLNKGLSKKDKLVLRTAHNVIFFQMSEIMFGNLLSMQ